MKERSDAVIQRHCHCERREAIQRCFLGGLTGLPRRFAARNDGIATYLAAKGCAGGYMTGFSLRSDETTSQSTWQPQDGCQVAGYPREQGLVFGWLSLLMELLM